MRKLLTILFVAILFTAHGQGYTSHYPPAFSGTYVKATTTYYQTVPYAAFDTSVSVVGASVLNKCWISDVSVLNNSVNVDYGSSFVANRIYYENYHNSGNDISFGLKSFTLWGSNSATDFSDLTYANDGTWTQITGLSQSYFDQHSASDAADPKYITFTNTNAYRYYRIKTTDSWGGVIVGFRRIELQSKDVVPPTPTQLNFVRWRGSFVKLGGKYIKAPSPNRPAKVSDNP